MTENIIKINGLYKSFTLHNQGGVRLPILHDVSLNAERGECVAINGPSGTGKSTLLRCIYGNYRTARGSIRVKRDQQWIDVAAATPRQILQLRADTIGYVSQFLRVIPRVPAFDIILAPMLAAGIAVAAARARAAELLERLHIPSRLWTLPPATFSGGEQQRINIAHGFSVTRPVLLLDEPTSALDSENRMAVMQLIREARERGVAVLGIFHDAEVRDAVATRILGIDLQGQLREQ